MRHVAPTQTGFNCPSRRPSVLAIIHYCEQAGAFLLLELRGQGAVYFLEPGTVRVATETAEEAVRSGWLAVRDRDLFGRPMSWTFAPKNGAGGAPRTSHRPSNFETT